MPRVLGAVTGRQGTEPGLHHQTLVAANLVRSVVVFSPSFLVVFRCRDQVCSVKNGVKFALWVRMSLSVAGFDRVDGTIAIRTSRYLCLVVVEIFS